MAGKNTTGFLGWVTLVVALSTCAIVGFAINKSPKTITAKDITDQRIQFDPTPGRVFDLASVGTSRIIVTIGDCSSCSVLNTDFDELKAVDTSLIVGLYKRGSDTSALGADYEWLKLVEDKDDLHTRLNAFFSPRAYIFDEKGGLLALQKPDEHLHDFLERSRELL